MSTAKRQKFYITTSIPYANAAPHVGHILDPLIADVLARHHRIKGYDVRFLVGTDEHGAKIVRKAEEEKKTPKQLVDENSEQFRTMHKILNISFDDFIRTSDRKRHWPGAQKMWRAFVKSGDIFRKKYRGLYCVGHEAFVMEKDLVGGVCEDHQKAPEVIEEENWFFRLSKYAKEIESRIKHHELVIIPETRKNEILSFIEQGLEDVSFSRPAKDLSWGVPVLDDPTQTMYVWCDALVNYISAIGYGQEKVKSKKVKVKSFEYWWPAEVQAIGKDNLRFHAAIWPGMLLSAGLKLPKLIFVHGFVNVNGQKISKTVGNVIAPEVIVKKYGVDPVRYYFLREFPSYEDGDFSYKKFEERYNGDLANGLGNLVARVTTLAAKLQITNHKSQITNKGLSVVLAEVKISYEKAMEDIRLNGVLEEIWRLIHSGDRYINEEKPWEQEKPDVIADALLLILEIASLLEPFLPETAEKIRGQIRVTDGRFEIKKSGNLFPRFSQ
ncbi:MAG: methionine--tRNA ligase [Candidatus Sungbacteria bacterium RIFCSPHIGHO2_02_FULL_47_11]|uniref:Methionine--tRNA ligase n=1 Tax=Candidatus Sungbacteria bacterium RIFCSPHIGHO2_02_FULL_47_11 TaxID=1802270 RepID=A0A1G2KL18_9BACT|nr:MAG: methionine--tRNA ligase [Candidatus Sungbacteria bacterium RIFCSPHIGHO2_02_FULL_47_11]